MEELFGKDLSQGRTVEQLLATMHDGGVESGVLTSGLRDPTRSHHSGTYAAEGFLTVANFPDLTVGGAHLGHPYEALLIQCMPTWPQLHLMTPAHLATYMDPALVSVMGSSRGRPARPGYQVGAALRAPDPAAGGRHRQDRQAAAPVRGVGHRRPGLLAAPARLEVPAVYRRGSGRARGRAPRPRRTGTVGAAVAAPPDYGVISAAPDSAAAAATA